MMLVFLATIPYTSMPRGFWTDEFFTATYTRHPTIGMVLDDVRKNEQSPPLYFLLMWLWVRFLGTSEGALRFPSVLAGMLSVGLLTFLVQRWFAQKAAAMAGMVMALSPLIARYAIEARPYSMLVFASVVCLGAFEYLYRYPDRRLAQVLYAVAATTLLFTSYFGAAMLAAHHFIWFVRLLLERSRWKQRLSSWLVPQLAMGVVLMPWLPTFLYQIRIGPAVTLPHITMPLEENFTRFLLLALSAVAYTESSVTLFPITIFALLWGLFLYGLVFALGDPSRRGIVLRVAVVPIVMTIAMMFSLQVSSPRYVIVTVPSVAIGVGVGWLALCQRLPRAGRMVGGAIFLLILIYRLPDVMHPPPAQNPWKEMTTFVAQQADPAHDVVVVYPPFELRSFLYYHDDGDGQLPRALGAYHYDEFYFVQKHDLATDWTVDQIVQETQGYRHLWLIFRPYYGQASPHSLPYPLVGHWRFGCWEPRVLELLKYRISEPTLARLGTASE